MRHTIETHGALKSLGSILLSSYCLDGLNLRDVRVRDTELISAALFLISRPLCLQWAVLLACKESRGKHWHHANWERLPETFLFRLFVCSRLARCVNIYNTPESFPQLYHQSLSKGLVPSTLLCIPVCGAGFDPVHKAHWIPWRIFKK